MNGTNRNVTIVGAGVVGMSTAVHLLRDGHQVTVVDRDDPGQGCSFGNAGILAPHYCVPLSVPGTVWNVPGWLFDPLGPLSIRWRDAFTLAPWFLRFILAGSRKRATSSSIALRALHETCVQDFQAFFGSLGAGEQIKSSGIIYAYETEKEFNSAKPDVELIRAQGAKVELIDGSQVREMVPEITPNCLRGIYMPEDGQVISPIKAVEILAEEFRRNGGKILKREVRDIVSGLEGPSRLVCDGETLELDALVIAAGAFSGSLAARLGSPVPLVGERGYHVTLPDPGFTLSMPIMSGECKFAMTSFEMGLRAAGTAEFASLDAPPNYKRAKVLLTHLKRLFPGVNPEGYSEWMGHRPSLPDSLPVIGPSPHIPHTFFAFGHGHAGLMGSVITGRTIADLMAGRTPDLDLEPFRVDRF